MAVTDSIPGIVLAEKKGKIIGNIAKTEIGFLYK